MDDRGQTSERLVEGLKDEALSEEDKRGGSKQRKYNISAPEPWGGD